MSDVKKKGEVLKKENQFVFERNDLLRACYKCNITQKRLIEMAISTIQTEKIVTLFEQKNVPIAKFKISDFTKLYGLVKTKNQKISAFNLLKNNIRTLGRAFFSTETDDYYERINWFQSVKVSEKKDEVVFKFTDEVGDRILELTKNYGKININVTKKFNSFYAAKWYDYATSLRGMRKQFFDLSEKQIRDFMGIGNEKYKNRLNNFKANVIDKPLAELYEIDECDFFLTYQKISSDEEHCWRFYIELKNKPKTKRKSEKR